RVPVDLVRRVPVGYRPNADEDGLTTPPGQLLTGDHNLVNVQVIVDYSVDQDAVAEYVVQAERVDGLVARAAEAAVAEWVAGHPVDEVLLLGKVQLPGWVLGRTKERLGPYRLGIYLRSASVAHLLPPEEVKPAFDEVSRAQAAIRTREQEARQ